MSKICLVIPFFGLRLVGCCVWGGVLCENCIVDANAIKKQQFIVVVCFSFLWFCSWYFLLSVREKCFVFFVLRAHGGCLGMLSR